MLTHSWVNKIWYQDHPLRWILAPFSMVFAGVVSVRRFILQRFMQRRFPIPIIVVGNLTVGGVGKTPLVITLANTLRAKGLRVGIVSRGYGARGPFPRAVQANDDAHRVGDEPLLMAKKTTCPVVIAPKRPSAVQYLLKNYPLDVIISDDGLQHYAMGRAIEIVVIDGIRGLGNGLMLPAGPLRESKKRLQRVDFVIVNGGEWPDAYRMDLVAGELTQLISGKVLKPTAFHSPVAAVAGIGNPKRFYQTLTSLKLDYTPYPFADHHQFTSKELAFNEKTVVMTEKDAVKCVSFATEQMYFLPVEAHLCNQFWNKLWAHKTLKEVNTA